MQLEMSRQAAFDAVCRSNEQRIREALRPFADGDSLRYWSGATLVHVAVAAGQERSLEVLLELGLSPEAKTADGTTPLMKAVENAHVGIAKILIGKGVELNTQDANGRTALMRGIVAGFGPCAELLLRYGADDAVRDHSGLNARQLAMTSGNLPSALFLCGRSAVLVQGYVPPDMQSNLGVFELVADVALYFADLVSDMLAASALLGSCDERLVGFGWAVLCCSLLPSLASMLLPAQTGVERVMSILQVRWLYETVVSLSQDRFSVRWATLKVLMSILEDIPNTLIQTYIALDQNLVPIDIAGAGVVGAAAPGRNSTQCGGGGGGGGSTSSISDYALNASLFVSIAISIVSNSQTYFDIYMHRFCEGDQVPFWRQLRFSLLASLYAAINVALRFTMWTLLLLYFGAAAVMWRESGSRVGLGVMVAVAVAPLWVLLRNFHIARVHGVPLVLTDYLISLFFDGAFAHNRFASITLSLASLCDLLLLLILPVSLGAQGVAPFRLLFLSTEQGQGGLCALLALQVALYLCLDRYYAISLTPSPLDTLEQLEALIAQEREEREGAREQLQRQLQSLYSTSARSLTGGSALGSQASARSLAARRQAEAEEVFALDHLKLGQCLLVYKSVPSAFVSVLALARLLLRELGIFAVQLVQLVQLVLGCCCGVLRRGGRSGEDEMTTAEDVRRAVALQDKPADGQGRGRAAAAGGCCFRAGFVWGQAPHVVGLVLFLACAALEPVCLLVPDMAGLAFCAYVGPGTYGAVALFGSVYLALLIESWLCSEARYLRNMVPMERGFDEYCSYHAAAPRLRFLIIVFHRLGGQDAGGPDWGNYRDQAAAAVAVAVAANGGSGGSGSSAAAAAAPARPARARALDKHHDLVRFLNEFKAIARRVPAQLQGGAGKAEANARKLRDVLSYDIRRVDAVEFELDEWWTECSPFPDLPPTKALLRARFAHEYEFADQETRHCYNRAKELFIKTRRTHVADEEYLVLEDYSVEGDLQKSRRRLLFDPFRNSRFFRYSYYTLGTLLLGSLWFRTKVRRESAKEDLRYIKLLRSRSKLSIPVAAPVISTRAAG